MHDLIRTADDLLAGIHLVAAAEALALGQASGLDLPTLYTIIKGAAGTSKMFETVVPGMIDQGKATTATLKDELSRLSSALTTARAFSFHCPLGCLAEQTLIGACASDLASRPSSSLIEFYRRFGLPTPTAAASQIQFSEKGKRTPKSVGPVAFIGLGSMGHGMAIQLHEQGFDLTGYDIYAPNMEPLARLGAKVASSASEAAKGAKCVVLMVVNATQAEDVLFDKGVVEVLDTDASIILCSTIAPTAAVALSDRLTALPCRSLALIDAPVSGGALRALRGDLTIMASCAAPSSVPSAHFTLALPVLQALSGAQGRADNLHLVPGGPGSGSKVKLVNQYLAGCHIAAAAEATAFCARVGADPTALHEYALAPAGSPGGAGRGGSWIISNRGPRMLKDIRKPESQVDIFVKDLGIVAAEARALGTPVWLAAAAHQEFLAASAAGWGKDDDSGVVRLWSVVNGISVREATDMAAMAKQTQRMRAASRGSLPRSPAKSKGKGTDQSMKRSLKEVEKEMPPPWEGGASGMVRKALQAPEVPVLVVLDDDPTGTQTVHDIQVLMTWEVDVLVAEFQKKAKGFFILTNSRAYHGPEARALVRSVTKNVKAAAEQVGVAFEIVLRGDSTLRGHFPDEPEAVEEVLGPCAAWVICPFFLQGGRFTVEDIHYVADADGDTLVPAAETPFAKDASFGYSSSHLHEWVLEKAGVKFTEDAIHSITLRMLRSGSPQRVASWLTDLADGSVVVVNALAEQDIDVFVAGLLISQQTSGRRYLFRTAAAFVSARLGINPRPSLEPKALGLDKGQPNQPGGLIVVGSYVPKTAEQADVLIKMRKGKLEVVEVQVGPLLESDDAWQAEVRKAVAAADAGINSGTDVLVLSERKLVQGKSPRESLGINQKVAAALVEIVKGTARPRYIIAKGGVTSSDVASKALGLRTAKVLGQAMPGVPLWSADDPSSLHPGVPFAIFPGNVGSPSAVADLVAAYSNA